MSQDRKLTDTVWEFLDRAGPMYARLEEERFRQEMHSNCIECGMASPIEDLFWIACYLLCKAAYTEFNPGPEESLRDQGVRAGQGIHVAPQTRIGSYRVDFLMTQERIGPDDLLTPVVVELDGHDFHDKDKRQRSYEKARDRFLVREGYRVLHFTGSDVVKDPFACAFEALEMLGAFCGSGITKYDPKNPLGIDLE